VSWKGSPFCPVSRTASDQLLDEVSNAPPIDDMDPEVEPRLGWYLPLELGLCEDSYRGKAYSLLGDAVDGESSGDGNASTFLPGWGEDMMIISRPRKPLEGL
jgi:hypothetical protein